MEILIKSKLEHKMHNAHVICGGQVFFFNLNSTKF